MRRTVARIRLLAFFLFPVATAAASVTINNPSFEASSGWEGLVTGTKLYFAPPDGLAYASVDGEEYDFFSYFRLFQGWLAVRLYDIER
eukprot:955542-Amorphochlora_amoeboformis.AAC.1